MNTNAYRLSFWMIAFILKNDLIHILRRETAPGFDSEHMLCDSALLLDTKSCPVLDAVYLETLRMTTVSNSVREIEEDISIGGYRLRRGNIIMCPSIITQRAEEIWGPDPSTFDHTRFLKNPKIKNYAGYRPYGGGNTLCPGRFQARAEVLAMVMSFFQMYNVESLGPAWVPTVNTFKPRIGTRDPICAHLFKVKVSPRTEK